MVTGKRWWGYSRLQVHNIMPLKKKKSYMREGMGRPVFTLFGVGKASVGIVHPAPVIILAKLEHTGHCLQTA